MITINTADGKKVNVGTDSFLHCFYSTITTYVEGVPFVSEFLQKKHLKSSDCLKAARELNIVRDRLSAEKPEKVIWDINDLTKQPPWGNDISYVITSLGNYFITADGKDLIYSIIELLQYANEEKHDVVIS